MDVTNVEQVRIALAISSPANDAHDSRKARIAEEAGACAVMALERVPADIRKEGGVARMVSRYMRSFRRLMTNCITLKPVCYGCRATQK